MALQVAYFLGAQIWRGIVLSKSLLVKKPCHMLECMMKKEDSLMWRNVLQSRNAQFDNIGEVPMSKLKIIRDQLGSKTW